MRFKRTFYVEKRPEEALQFIADFSNLKQWDESVESVQLLSDVFCEGAEYDVRVMFAGKAITMRYIVTSFKEGESAVLTGTAEKAKAVDIIRVRQSDSTTCIEYSAQIILAFPYSLLDWLLAIRFSKTVNDAVDGIKRALST